jgi:hypothetical protein
MAACPRTGRCELAAEDQPEPAQREELRLHLQGVSLERVIEKLKMIGKRCETSVSITLSSGTPL